MTDPDRPAVPGPPGPRPPVAAAGAPAARPPAPPPAAPPDDGVGDLVDLVGAAAAGDAGAAVWRDPRFVAWLAAEARAADRAQRRQADAAFLTRGAAFLARAQARRAGVARYAGPPLAAPAPRRVREGAGRWTADAGAAVPVIDLGVAAGPGRELWDEPPARWVRRPAGLPDARYLALRVVGTSMTPLLASGDVVLVRADAWGREPRAGRVVVARHPEDGYVCKRVRAVEARRVVLGSLEPGHGPVVLPRDPALVVGTVVAAWPGR